MRRVIWYILVIAITLMLLILLWQFSVSFILFALSLAVSSALKPFIARIASRIKSKPLALGLVYSVLIGLVLISLLLGGQFLLRDLQTAADDLVLAYNHIKNAWPLGESPFQRALADQLPYPDELFQAFLSEDGLVSITQQGIPGQDIFSLFGYVAIIIVLSVYWSADQLRFERISISLFPVEYRPKALHIWRTVENGVGAYLRSEVVQSFFAGLILWVIYWIIGLKYPALLAFWAAIARLVPWFGIVIALIPILLISGIFSFSGLVAILLSIVIVLLLRAFIEPRILERKRNNSLLIVFFVIVLAEAFGFIGVLLAPPLATALQIILQELYPLFTRRYVQELHEAFILRQRLTKVRKEIKGSVSDETMQLVNQLYGLVNQAITYIQKY